MVEQARRAGQRIGNYRLLQLLGRGGFAEVYLAEHIHLNTQAAVKLLLTRLASENVDSFRNEARMIAHLVHPHIVRVLDFGVEEDIPYLVMDYAPNGTLRLRHAKGTRLPLATVVSYVQQVAEALQYAHDQRLIHRDVKPENMLLGRNGEVLLSDFGIALAAQSSQYQTTQNVAGTIAYMAPEQIQAHPRPASDQYSLGIVVYEWLSGQRPFQGTMTEIAVKHASAPPPPLCAQVPDLPHAIEQVTLIALQKDPHRRFPTILGFSQALEQASAWGQSSRSFASGFSTSAFVPPPTSQLSMPPAPIPQAPSQHQPAQVYASAPSFPAAMPANGQLLYAQPMPYSAYPPYPTPPLPYAYPPAQQAMPQQKPRRVSRRTAIGAIAGVTGVAAIGGLTYYAYSKLASVIPHQPGISSLIPGNTSSSVSPLITFQDHTDLLWSVAWSPDGKYIASASKDGTSHVWDVSARQRLLSYRSQIHPSVNDDWAMTVTWTTDSKNIGIAFFDGTVQMVDITKVQQTHTYNSAEANNLTGALYGLAFSPDGRYLALGGFFSYDIQIFDVAAQRRIRTLSGHTDTIYALEWSHNGRYLASGSADTTTKVWRVSDGRLLLNYDKQGSDVRAVSWSPDDTRIVSAGLSENVYIWTSDAGQTLLSYNKHVGGEVFAAAWSPNGRYIASGGNDVNTHVWDAQSGQLLHAFYTFPIFGVSWSPDSSRIVTGGYNKVALVWPVGG